jgi:hypothetical protein
MLHAPRELTSAPGKGRCVQPAARTPATPPSSVHDAPDVLAGIVHTASRLMGDETAAVFRRELDDFARRELGALLDYDATNGTDLQLTLQRYLENGCKAQRTAAEMYVHSHTVNYRLRRITELTGLRLNDHDDRFRAQLACKILDLGA